MADGLPDFIVVGAMKAGTSSLWHYLRSNPAVYMPAIKEVNFFRGGNDFRKGVDWYREQFAEAAPGQLLGEASPDYSKFPYFKGAPTRIHDLMPDVKLIFLAREPVARMRSQFLHQVSENREQRPIDEALLEDGHYLEVSQYGMQLDQWLELFPREQILVVASERLSQHRDETLTQICDFIGIAHIAAAASTDDERNRSADRRKKSALLKRITASARVQKIAARMPAGLKRKMANALSKPIETETHVLAPATVEILQQRLADDLARFAQIAPDVVAEWDRKKVAQP